MKENAVAPEWNEVTVSFGVCSLFHITGPNNPQVQQVSYTRFLDYLRLYRWYIIMCCCMSPFLFHHRPALRLGRRKLDYCDWCMELENKIQDKTLSEEDR